MKYINSFKLFEEGGVAMATAGNTGGMGAVAAPQPSSIPGDVAGSTKGSGDLPAYAKSKSFSPNTKRKKKCSKCKDRKKRGIGESTENIETMYVTRFDDWDYPKT